MTDWLEFYSTFSTTKLYRAFEKHVPVEKVKVTTINYNK